MDSFWSAATRSRMRNVNTARCAPLHHRFMSVRHLDKLLHPASIAVIGVSERAQSIGAIVLRNLRAGGFAGPVWAVNPARDVIAGERAWQDVASLQQAPGLGV